MRTAKVPPFIAVAANSAAMGLMLLAVFAAGTAQAQAQSTTRAQSQGAVQPKAAQTVSAKKADDVGSLAPETMAILQPKLRAWIETLEERARKVMGQQLADGRFLLYVKADVSAAKFASLMNGKQKSFQLTTLPVELSAAEKEKIVAESLTVEQVTLIVSALKVTLTFNTDVPDAQAKALQDAITNALSLNKERGDAVVVKKASLSASFSEVTKDVEKLRYEVSLAQQKAAEAQAAKTKLEAELRASQEKASAADERIKEEKEKVKRMEEDLSIYKTPLGDIKKIIKGLEVPLTVLPIAVLLFVFSTVGFFVYLRFQGAKTNKLMQAADVMAQAFAKANRASGPGGLTLDAARAEFAKLTASQNHEAANALASSVPHALLGEELASAKQKAMDAWSDLKKHPYLTHAELREWLVGGGAQTQRFIALGNALGPVESMRLLQHFAHEDLAMLRGDSSENASELPGYAALLQLHRKVMAEVIRRPSCVATLNFPEIVRASDDALISAVSENTPVGIALCISLLPDARASKILEALPPEKKSACIDGVAKLDELNEGEIEAELATLKSSLAPMLASVSSVGMGAAEKISQIMRESTPKTRAALQESLGKHEKLRSKITQKMLTFEDVLTVEDETLSELLDEFEPERIAVLVCALDKAAQERIAKTLSRKVVIAVQSELQRLGARSATLRRAHAQSGELQAYLIDKLKTLVDEGVVEIRRKDTQVHDAAAQDAPVPRISEGSETNEFAESNPNNSAKETA